MSLQISRTKRVQSVRVRVCVHARVLQFIHALHFH